MLAKLQVTGTIKVETGMHIGDSQTISVIGMVDEPVIRDVWSAQPIIPGSSLKGKLRALLTQYCEEEDADADSEISQLFGYYGSNVRQRSRLIFRDLLLQNEAELHDQGLERATK